MRKKMKNGILFSSYWFSSLRIAHRARLHRHFRVSTLGLPWPLHSWTPDPGCCCCSSVTKSCLSFVTPWAVACQALLSMGFPRQEYWGRLPFPSPGHLSDLGIKLVSSSLAGRFFTTEPLGKPPVPDARHNLEGTCPWLLPWGILTLQSCIFLLILPSYFLTHPLGSPLKPLLFILPLLWRASSSLSLPPPPVRAPQPPDRQLIFFPISHGSLLGLLTATYGIPNACTCSLTSS